MAESMLDDPKFRDDLAKLLFQYQIPGDVDPDLAPEDDALAGYLIRALYGLQAAIRGADPGMVASVNIRATVAYIAKRRDERNAFRIVQLEREPCSKSSVIEEPTCQEP